MKSNFFGHPRGLATLFFTEMWERFSYYGMRALLMLFMITGVEKGGLGLNEESSGAIYGIYTMLVYMMALPGGWMADTIWGLRKSVFYGACIICSGHLLMALNSIDAFFVGLLLIAIGTGLLKPNISSLVGELYQKEENAKRDSGYSLFFMGINIGAFVAPFITGYFGEKVNWHYGFGIAGIGMFIGLIQYKVTEKLLGAPQINVFQTREIRNRSLAIVGFSVLALSILVALLVLRIVSIDPVWLAKALVYVLVTCAIIYFSFLLIRANLTSAERKSVWTILGFFITSVVFYMGYEQQGSSLNLFALRYTDLNLGDFSMPASWFQSVPAVAVLIFAPFFAWLWLWLSRKNIDPATSSKLALGLLFVAASFVVMAVAGKVASQGSKVAPWWLIGTYLLHTFGEICLYPVGLSAVKKLAPEKYSGQLMGVWFMSLALGNLMAGLLTSRLGRQNVSAGPGQMTDLFLFLAIVIGVIGLLTLLIRKRTTGENRTS